MKRHPMFFPLSTLYTILICVLLNTMACEELMMSNGCNNKGTFILRNSGPESVEILVDGVSHGFVSPGNSIRAEVVADIPHLVEFRKTDGRDACTDSMPSVAKCETITINCNG